MFGFIKVFVVLLSVYTIGSFGKSFCRSAPVINSDELFLIHLLLLLISRGSCITIDDPYARNCVPDKVKIWN